MSTMASRRGHPLWEEPAGFTASRILDEGYGEMTDLRPVGAGPGFNNVNNGWPRASRRGHPLWEEPAGFTASRILDEGYGEMTDLRPVDAGPGFNNVNNGWPRLRATLDGPGCPTLDGPGCPVAHGLRWVSNVGWPRLPGCPDGPGYPPLSIQRSCRVGLGFGGPTNWKFGTTGRFP